MQVGGLGGLSRLLFVRMRNIEREVPPELAAQWDRDDYIPREWLTRIAQLGVCGLTVPQEYGGLGMNVMGVLATIQELYRLTNDLRAEAEALRERVKALEARLGSGGER